MFGFLTNRRAKSLRPIPSQPLAISQDSAQPEVCHRQRLLAKRLEHLKICSPHRAEKLATAGIRSGGDLLYCDPQAVAKKLLACPRAERAIRRYRAAIRLAVAIEGMMPRDAMLLVAIHRRSVDSVSLESPAQLHRDLERFAMSTRGRKMIGSRGLPSLRRIKQWIATCQEMSQTQTISVAA